MRLFFLLLFFSFFTKAGISQSDVKPDSALISIIGVGDMMLGTNFPSAKYLPPDSGKNLLRPVEHILQDANVTFGNLEGVFLNEGGEVKRCSDSTKCYAFRMPDYLIDPIKEAGFDVMSIANNHIGDFGHTGRKNTMKTLEKAGIHYAGLLEVPAVIFEKEGVKYGFCAFAPNTGTCDIRQIEAAQEIVKNLNDSCDIVIVSFHGGAEGSDCQYVPRETEMFYGEDRGNVFEFSRSMIDAGADVVFGHGPHVTRALDLYKDRFIIYSLGNFCTYARFSLSGPNGIAPIIKVYTDKEGNFIKGEVIPIKQTGSGGPIIDPEKAAIKKLQYLTQKDFPEVNISISDDGIILPE